MRVAVIGPPGGGVTPVGVKEQLGPLTDDGCTEQVREMGALNPATDVAVNVEVADCPGLTTAGIGVDAAIEKSGEPYFTMNASPGTPAGPLKVV